MRKLIMMFGADCAGVKFYSNLISYSLKRGFKGAVFVNLFFLCLLVQIHELNYSGNRFEEKWHLTLPYRNFSLCVNQSGERYHFAHI